MIVFRRGIGAIGFNIDGLRILVEGLRDNRDEPRIKRPPEPPVGVNAADSIATEEVVVLTLRLSGEGTVKNIPVVLSLRGDGTSENLVACAKADGLLWGDGITIKPDDVVFAVY